MFRKRDSSVVTAITLRVKRQNKWGPVPGREIYLLLSKLEHSPSRDTPIDDAGN